MTESFRLLDVPPEVLVHILGFLPLQALHACQQSSRFLHGFVTASIELQYLIARSVAQVTDNPSSTLPISDRLRMLRSRETAFTTANPSWVTSIPVPFQMSGVYDLSAGFLFFGEDRRNALRYIQLPSERPPEGAPPVEWGRIPVSSPQSMIIDFGLAIGEHDLVVIATFTPTGPTTAVGVLQGLINLELLTMSTHRPHPESRGPIEVGTSSWGLPSSMMEVVGDYLVFGESYGGMMGGLLKPDDHVYIYEWRTGKLKMKIDAPNRSYFAAVFLSPEVLLLPNTTAATLELWTIPSEQTTPTPTLTLHLPRLASEQGINVITARGEPNPSVYPLRKPSRLPFYSSVDDSIILFHIHFPVQKFLLFIHRRTLLALLDKHTVGDTCVYADWGPGICRWLLAAGINVDWITTTSGQRSVLTPMRTTTPLFFFDFNRYMAQSHPHACLPPTDDPFSNFGIWAEPVGSRLECHASRSTETFSVYDGVSMDDERVVAFWVGRSLLSLLIAMVLISF
ncbi:hypothetical protein B0H17DRAFT_1044692 [Mycena rosella]|uniref:F-box domain-containing protein n=1 Tax=Mycena rosella TaxID=1033263 RepID=A0AAD7GR33_MYCRO|nr:hypothetical protein B0H17DRAFT_1044692 [Mycena rosella]